MNVAEKLAREIRRVTELRCQYEEVGKLPIRETLRTEAIEQKTRFNRLDKKMARLE